VVADEKGSLLFEAVLVILLLTAVLYRGHAEVVRRWQAEIRRLDKERLRYDGESSWKL
jgi:hypothetical protein